MRAGRQYMPVDEYYPHHNDEYRLALPIDTHMINIPIGRVSGKLKQESMAMARMEMYSKGEDRVLHTENASRYIHNMAAGIPSSVASHR